MGLDHSRANTTCLARGCVQSPGDPVAPAGSGVPPGSTSVNGSVQSGKLVWMDASAACPSGEPAEIVWCCEFRKQEE